MVWVSKLAEPIDANWFSSLAVDLILVIQGHLKFDVSNRLTRPTACSASA